jgi:hypothetical protein
MEYLDLWECVLPRGRPLGGGGSSGGLHQALHRRHAAFVARCGVTEKSSEYAKDRGRTDVQALKAMKGKSMRAKRQAWLKRGTLVIAGVMLATSVSGCSTFLERLRAETSYHHTGTKPQAEVAVVKPATKKQERQFGSVGSNTLRLAIIFYERLLVPKGATLTITVTDAKGKTTSTEITTTTGMPYRVDVPLGKAMATPLDVSVTLKSPAGHVLSGEKTFDSLPGSPTEFLIASGRR